MNVRKEILTKVGTVSDHRISGQIVFYIPRARVSVRSQAGTIRPGAAGLVYFIRVPFDGKNV